LKVDTKVAHARIDSALLYVAHPWRTFGAVSRLL
jgi:hypothetical protein